MLATVLESSGARVTLADSAAEALRAFQRERPHVLLLDIGLPDQDGFSLLKTLRGLPTSPDVPAIALTGYGSPDGREGSERGGFQMHLRKPVALADVLDALVRVLQSRQPSHD
jgi:CheY-like chemotaxis protein